MQFAVENMADASISLWLIASFIGLWLGFRLSHSMHEGAADSRAPNTARALVTTYCLSITMILVEVATTGSLPSSIQISCLLIAAVTASNAAACKFGPRNLLPGKDCQGRDVVE
jgi:uncharacterized membrane protein